MGKQCRAAIAAVVSEETGSECHLGGFSRMSPSIKSLANAGRYAYDNNKKAIVRMSVSGANARAQATPPSKFD